VPVPRPRIGGVARNILLVGGATALGQGAIAIAAPILARLYDPDAFGLLSVYAGLLSVLIAASSLRFDLAIPIASDAIEALHLLVLSVCIAVATSAVVALTVVVWGTQISTVLGVVQLGPYLWLLPIALLIASVAQSLSSWAVYHRSFPQLGRMRAIQGVSQAVGQAVLGFLHVGSIGLIVGDVAGRFVGVEQLFRPLRATLRTTKVSLQAVRRYARERWRFARVMTGASFLNALSLQVPFLLIPALFDLRSSGQYFLAYRVLVLPGSLVAAAVSQVFFGEASFRGSDERRLHDLAYNAAISLFVFSIPTYAIVAAVGPSLISTVFGAQWDLAGTFAQLMAPSLILWSVANPISSLLLVGRRERESLAFTAAELLLKAGALGFGALVHSLTVGIIVLSVVSVLINVAALWRFLRVASVTLGDLVRPLAAIAALTAGPVAVIIVVSRALPAALLVVSAIGWAVALLLAVRFLPQPRAFLSGIHD
jgi:O-antigen/teichoic acid export membrane protein